MSATIAHCRSCEAEAYWLASEVTDRMALIDAQPSPAGDIEIDLHNRTYRIVPEEERATAGALHTSHFATCPQRDEWRKKGEQRRQAAINTLDPHSVARPSTSSGQPASSAGNSAPVAGQATSLPSAKGYEGEAQGNLNHGSAFSRIAPVDDARTVSA